jgi:hypothetical protein
MPAENYPGRLPCPEPGAHAGVAANEGIAAPYVPSGQTVCSNVGRLPWRTLGVDQLRDASGEPLWYVVTTGAAGWALGNSATVLSINSNKANSLTVNAQASMAVAAIIAPGPAITVNPNANQIAAGCAARTQNRSPTPPNYLDYVECHNTGASSILTNLVDNATNPSFNDQVVLITAAEVMSAIEGVIASRIRDEIVPRLVDTYVTNAAWWGGTTTAPIFPYVARFRNEAATTFNPENYRGRRYSDDANATTAQTQGLLPMTADALAFTTATISATQTGGTATTFNANCAASTTALISCNISYSRLLCLIFCGITANVRVQATVPTVGFSLRTVNTAAGSGLTTLTAPLQADGSALATYTGTLNGGSSGICGSFLGVLCTGNATITVPISMFQNHPLANPVSTDSWYWFVTNKWHEVTYYAVAPSHLPSAAAHNCTTALPSNDCLALTNGNPAANLQSLLVLAGRSMTNLARPNANLADFLDAANGDGDRTFVQNKVGAAFNDRAVVISNY